MVDVDAGAVEIDPDDLELSLPLRLVVVPLHDPLDLAVVEAEEEQGEESKRIGACVRRSLDCETLARQARMPSTLEHGHCFVCGTVGDFVNLEDEPTRENHRCGDCNASLRYRHQAEVLLAIYGKNKSSLAELVNDERFRTLAIYEPGIVGPLRKLLRHLPRYVHSYYWQNVEPSEIHDDVRCEGLQHLTFRGELFDLVISSDIFEHVRDPWEGFAEVFRVLRPGGSHVFTVPVSWPLVGHTIARVDTSGPADIHVLPPQYHRSPTDPEGSLVYTEFGLDLPDRIRELGFHTCVYHGYRHNLTFVSARPL